MRVKNLSIYKLTLAMLNLYPNNLKNWEFGEEAPQNSHLERANIVGVQGASEDENFEEKPTLPKTNSSSCLGIGAHLYQ
jgi:hypothetical protein